jgi:hypothetical protein
VHPCVPGLTICGLGLPISAKAFAILDILCIAAESAESNEQDSRVSCPRPRARACPCPLLPGATIRCPAIPSRPYQTILFKPLEPTSAADAIEMGVSGRITPLPLLGGPWLAARC